MNGFVIVEAVVGQKFRHIVSGPALIVNAKIDPAVECQRDILIELQAAGQIVIQTGPCVRHIFGISGPAFHITKEVHSLAQGIRVCGGEGRLLIEMSGIAFMGQCRKKGQIVSNLAVIQVNHIAVSDIHRRNHIKGGIHAVFQ